MVVIVCSVPGCEFTSGEVTEALAIALLTNHGLAHQAIAPPTASVSTPVPRGPKLERPKVDVGVTTEEWNVFVRRWEVFRAGSGINDTSAPSQLFQCAGSDLGDSLLKVNANPITDSLAQLLASMRSLAVIPVATGVLRTELLQLRQERDETFRAFAARVRGKAETCAFEATCECGNKVDYTNHVIRDVLLSGISDPDIRREALGTLDILTKAVNDVIALVEYKEMARNALPSSTLSAVSSFRRRNETLVAPTTTATPPQSDRGKQAPCPDCKHPYNLFSKGARGWNSKPHQVCIDCYRIRRRRNLPQRTSTTAVQAVAEDTISQVAALQRDGARHRQQRRRRRHRRTHPASGAIIKLSPVKIDHQVFTAGEWKRARLRANPRVAITVNMDISAQAKYGDQNLFPDTAVEVTAIADTGAQSDLWSLATFLSCGFTRDSLLPVTLSLSAANHSPIVIEGAFFAKLTAKSRSGEVSSCRSMVYVSSTVRDMYLSYDSMLSLGILANDFPSFNDTSGRGESNESSNPPRINATREINCGCDAPGTPDESCSCPQRAAAPPRPSALPFLPTPENNERMEAWLRDRYASSTFNTCPHRALPCMEGPPVEIHVDPSAEPKACHTPANVPLHWQKRVYEDLLRDEALGVIERVPYGEPVTWCHRMVVTRKHDGSPRRTVDLSPLNKFCKRETFAMESPFHLARRIPMDTWKTVTDAWNGYHSVPLRESDRPLTTFITPFGRWRYTRAPQGFLSSGDGYNRRFDAVLSNVERKERCVDDTIHYDADLEQHWWRTIDILTRIGQAGIVLNPSKFQFAGRSVDFAGFRISDSTIEPLPKYLDAIRDFPRPTSTTDIRSWFGLVNQVANYAQLRDVMAPFKPFLSPRCTFLWSTELEQAFQTSKQAIIEAIRTGVEIFDITRRTCLRPDWSNRGIGYFLLQKHCSCLSSVPDCCPGGWRVTLAGSRFLLPAEQRYAAIEGEALAIAWGLEQTKYFTQGCDDLIVITDHKPLVKIFGDRTLDEITNSRLFRLKQRTLSWRFDIEHLPGKSNSAADAASRHPSPSGLINSVLLEPVTVPDLIECALMTSIRQDAKELGTLSWPDIAQETTKDGSLGPLLLLIEQGVQEFDRSDDAIAPFWPIRESLYTQEGVLLFQDRVVIPSSLRPRVLEHLHAAHQGTSMMLQRARAIAYWPGMSNDIQKTREGCTDCNRNAPSQAATPPNPSPPPSTPFEAVFADFFDYGGNHYLVVGDRLSGWVEVFGSSAGTNLAGASGLVRHLRTFFGTFGVPEELSSDGGPEFTASLTQDFLRLWGVKHRKSSAYFPQSNGRAEVAVKTAKRLLTSNTGPTGSLDRDRFLGAMLQLRNTPDPDCNISPAQIIFGRPLRDALSFANRLEKFSNPNIRPLWRQAWAAKEDALRVRMTRTTESLKEHSRTLRPLKIGERAFLQNQQGNNPTKWDRSGTIVEARGNDQYLVKVDGSGRLTLRNRRFLRAYTPATPSVQQQTTSSPPPNPTGQQHRSQPSLAVPQMHPLMPLLQEIPVTQPQSPRREVPENINPSIRNLPGPDAENTPKVDTASTPVSQDTPLRSQRPRRAHRPPMQYEPETGKWI